MQMPYGIHVGKELESIPTDYFVYLLNCTRLKGKNLRAEITKVLNARNVKLWDLFNRWVNINSDELDQIASMVREDERRTVQKEKDKGEKDRAFVMQWYKKAAAIAHPDKGGDGRLMQMINQLKDHFEGNR